MRIPFFHREEKKPAYRQPEPTIFPELRSVDIAGMYRIARKGGDFYDAIVTAESRRLIFLILDISGEREETMHIAAQVQETFRTQAPKLFGETDLNEAEVLTELVLTLNRKIIDIAGAHFTPGFLGCYAQEYGTLCYINAGHTPALLMDASGITELAACGLPLGLFSHATHDAQMAVLQPGAALLLVSRGVVESKNKTIEFGLEGVKASMATASFNDAVGLCSAVLARAQAFANHAEPVNDVTTLALVRASAAKSAVHGVQ